MFKHNYILAIGGNIGDTKEVFKKAIEMFNERLGEVNKISKFYISKPLPTTHGIKQDRYLNGVLSLKSDLEPFQLLSSIHKIEEALGRDRINYIHWGPRTIDIDIISCDETIIETENLTIPHARMNERDFVLIPIRDIFPEYIHPVSKASINTLIGALKEDEHYIDYVCEE